MVENKHLLLRRNLGRSFPMLVAKVNQITTVQINMEGKLLDRVGETRVVCPLEVVLLLNYYSNEISLLLQLHEIR